MKKLLTVFISISLLIPTLISCNKADTDPDIKIVCTIFPYYDICSEILGSKENVTLLNDSGTDMHNYEPSLYDIKTISECDVFIYGGGLSEAWVENAVKSSQNDDIIMIRLMDHLDVYAEEFQEGMQHDSHDHSDEHEHTELHEIDEHVWLSLNNAVKIADIVCKTLTEIDSDKAEKYQDNYLSFADKLSSLDQSYTEAFKKLSKPLIFADRFPFRYFTEEYDLDYYAAFPGCSTESFASFNTIAFLIKTVREYDAEYIITIDSSQSEFAKTIVSETNCKIITLNSCQSVTQEDIKNGVTYFGIMESNYQIISEVFTK